MADTGVKYPATVSTLQETGDDNNWTTPANIRADDAAYASITAATFDSPDTSYLLRATNFSMGVPAGSIIHGILVEIERYYANGTVADYDVCLTKDGSVRVGDDKSTGAAFPRSPAITSFGGSADLWGTIWTVDEVNASTFGVLYKMQATLANADGFLDFIRITVYYTLWTSEGSRIATRHRFWRAAEDTPAISIPNAHCQIIALAVGSTGDVDTFKVQWRNSTDAGAWTDLGVSGEIVQGSDSELTNGNTVDAAEYGCSSAKVFEAEAGELESANTTPSITISANGYCEVQCCIDPINAHIGDVYEFRLYVVSDAVALNAGLATMTFSIDDNLDVQVGADANDGMVLGSIAFYTNKVWFGNYGGAGQEVSNFTMFTGITIPAGATATPNACYLTYTCKTASDAGSIPSNVYGNDVAAPTAPTSVATYNALVQTTAFVPWTSTAAWVLDSTYKTPDISAIIQEFINSYAPYSAGAMQFMHKDNGSASGKDRIPYDYTDSTTKCTKLHIEYTAGGAPSITGGYYYRMYGKGNVG